MDNHSHAPMMMVVIFTILMIYGLIGFAAVKMGGLNDRIKALEVTVQDLVVEPD